MSPVYKNGLMSQKGSLKIESDKSSNQWLEYVVDVNKELDFRENIE